MNLSPYMAPSGIVFIHDCNPRSYEEAEVRDGGVWMGDVWKTAVLLQRHWPGVEFFTFNCSYGLMVVTGLGNTPLPEASDEDIAACRDLPYDYLAANRRSLLRLRSPLYSRFFFRQHVRRFKA